MACTRLLWPRHHAVPRTPGTDVVGMLADTEDLRPRLQAAGRFYEAPTAREATLQLRLPGRDTVITGVWTHPRSAHGSCSCSCCSSKLMMIEGQKCPAALHVHTCTLNPTTMPETCCV